MELDDVLGHLITLNDMNNPKNKVLGQSNKFKNLSTQKNFFFRQLWYTLGGFGGGRYEIWTLIGKINP